jgi:hypothetical protein
MFLIAADASVSTADDSTVCTHLLNDANLDYTLQSVYGSPQVPDTHQRFWCTQMSGVVAASWAFLVAVGGCFTCYVLRL